MKKIVLIFAVAGFWTGLCIGFWVGQTYGQLQIACAVTMGADDLRGVSDCAGGPHILARYILTRSP